MKYDLVVIGGGPAGLASAYAAHIKGIENILIIERDKVLGGILNQCIHNGFGLHKFNEELTGPEYAQKYIDLVENTNINIQLNTMVLDIVSNSLYEKEIHVMGSLNGYEIISAKSIILSMGCRERTRGAIAIAGDRPSGIFTAGTAQRYINMEGLVIGSDVIILGSGDIGLIMARRLSLEGYNVKAVIELMDYSNGLTRNIVQCLDDYNIPLYLNHTIIEIIGKERLEKVIVAKVDENKKPIIGTEIEFNVDTLLLSVGLIPENELSESANIQLDKRTKGMVVNEKMETSINGIFACGNAVHVHDLVDFVSVEGELAGLNSYKFINHEYTDTNYVNVYNGDFITYTVPQKISNTPSDNVSISFRVSKILKNVKIIVKIGDKNILSFKREHCFPSEMEKVIIPKDYLQNIFEDITILIEAGE